MGAAAEALHVCSELDKYDGRGDFIHSRQSLQDVPLLLIRDHLLKEIVVEFLDLLLQIGDMIRYRGENPPVAFSQGLIQGLEQLRGFVLEPSFGKGHELHRRPAFNQSGDHGTRRGPIDVTDHPAQADAGIIEHLVQAILLRRKGGHQLLPLPGDHPQLTEVLGRNKARPDQSYPAHYGQPFAVEHIGLAPGDLLYTANGDNV